MGHRVRAISQDGQPSEGAQVVDGVDDPIPGEMRHLERAGVTVVGRQFGVVGHLRRLLDAGAQRVDLGGQHRRPDPGGVVLVVGGSRVGHGRHPSLGVDPVWPGWARIGATPHMREVR